MLYPFSSFNSMLRKKLRLINVSMSRQYLGEQKATKYTRIPGLQYTITPCQRSPGLRENTVSAQSWVSLTLLLHSPGQRCHGVPIVQDYTLTLFSRIPGLHWHGAIVVHDYAEMVLPQSWTTLTWCSYSLGQHCHKSLAPLPSSTGNDAGTKSYGTLLYQVFITKYHW